MKEKKVDKYIINALFELLTVKPLSEISATELIAKSGVSRSSYYRNFYLIEDVIKAYLDGFFDRLAAIPPVTLTDPKIHMREVYTQYLAERERLTILDKRGLLYLLYDKLNAFCLVQTHRLGRFKGPYQADFFAGASASIIRSWIHSGFKESPSELADITYSFIFRD